MVGKNDDKVHFHLPGKHSSVDTSRRARESIEMKELRQNSSNGSAGENVTRNTATLLNAVETQRYETVKERVTALALMNCGENPLLLAIKVTEKLRERALKDEPDKEDFNFLADQVEEFTLRFLDPLKYENLPIRRFFSVNPELDVILETAIKLEQKKLFDHPIVESIMNERWYTPMGRNWKISRPGLWLFLNIWCLFDVVLFPLTFILAEFLDWILSHFNCFFNTRTTLMLLDSGSASKLTGFSSLYRRYFTIPYFIFVRQTISYMTLLAFHFAICLERTEVSPSIVEGFIYVYLLGRLLAEIQQILDMMRSEDRKMKLKQLKNYLRSYWNIFDDVILIIFFCAILPLRIIVWVLPWEELESNNIFLKVAGHLYGFNTMLLAFRAFGSLLEAFGGVGTIQIALFHAIRDAAVIVVHLFVIAFAFSTTLTKVFVTHKEDGDEETEFHTWLNVLRQLGFALVELSDTWDFFKSSDPFSKLVIEFLFVSYVVVDIIFVVNMLIALLSNTYQQVQDNSQKEWAFQKAVTIQTFSSHHPIPVPFNIISMILIMLPRLRIKQRLEVPIKEKYWKKQLDDKVNILQAKYRLRYGDSFPPTEPLQQMMEEVNETKSMVNKIVHKTFTNQYSAFLPTGPKAWDAHPSIIIDDCLVTCQSYNPLYVQQGYFSCYGARYNKCFSNRFPHFEVMLIESADKGRVSLGVVDSSYNHGLAPGLGGSVGFNTDLKMFDNEKQTPSGGKQVTGIARVRSGDVIRCTVMFEQQQDIDGIGQIPVVFSVNGTRLVTEGGQIFIKHNPDKPWYPYIGFDQQNSALAKMVAGQDVDYGNLRPEEVNSEQSELTVVKAELSEAKTELTKVKAELTEVKSELSGVRSQLRESTTSLTGKLDALLTKISKEGQNYEAR